MSIEGVDDVSESYNEYTSDYQTYQEERPITAHQCNICNKILVSFKGLQQHSIIHTDTKPFVCEICGRRFRFKSNMFEHRSLHTGYSPFKCPFCGRSFRLKGNMKKHMKTHVTTKEELDAAYRPFSSNRRPPTLVPHDAILIRGSPTPIFSNQTVKHSRKLLLGRDPSKWIEQICRNELVPNTSIDDKIMRVHVAVFRQHTPTSLLNEGQSIEFEIYNCPYCLCLCGGRSACILHMYTAHGKQLKQFTEEKFCCEKCLRVFSEERILHQHLSYHSRVQMMICNREIEVTHCLPVVPLGLIWYNLLNGSGDLNSNNIDMGMEEHVPVCHDEMENITDQSLPFETISEERNVFRDLYCEEIVEASLDNPNEISLNPNANF